jgi:copper chaperone NosL
MKKGNISRLLFGFGTILLVLLFFFPIWRITLTAPQYPQGINMYIWINKITGDTESTLQNINILNHYVGMKFIEPDSIKELTYFPYVIGAMIFLGLLVTAFNKGWMKLSWISILIVMGIAGIYDFYLWEYDYGHNLSSLAPIKVPNMAYQPPIFGEKMLLNFKAESYPDLGTILMIVAIAFAIASYIIQKRKRNHVD